MSQGVFKFDVPTHHKSIIKVIGVGGGGSNAVNYMHGQGIAGVEFIVCNTDAQALHASPVPNKIQIGVNLTEGLGAGASPDTGKDAALENKEDIRKMLRTDTKMVFVTAGMGGGTGTGAAPIVAEVSKELGILTVGIVTLPFSFEGKKKMNNALKGLEELKAVCDTVIVILNDKILSVFGQDLGVTLAFSKADDVLTNAAKAIAEIITVPGYVNVDFKDVKTVMEDSGTAVMGSAVASGNNRAIRAIEEAVTSPLLNSQSIAGAEKVLLTLYSDTEELTTGEFSEISNYMLENTGRELDEVIWGSGRDASLGDGLKVTIIATGFDNNNNDGNDDPEEPEKVEMKITTTDDIIEQSVVEKKVHDLDRSSGIANGSANITSQQSDDTFELDFEQKLQTLNLETNVSSTPSEPQLSVTTQDSEFGDMHGEDIFNNEADTNEDAQLEELEEGSATPLSNSMRLREEAENRKARLDGLKKIEVKDEKDYKEMFNNPAFKRKGIVLDKTPLSSDSQVSKMHLNDDAELGRNRFLHDNVD